MDGWSSLGCHIILMGREKGIWGASMNCSLRPGRVNQRAHRAVLECLLQSQCWRIDCSHFKPGVKRRAAGLKPVKTEHQHTKFLPEQLWKRHPERYSIILSKCCHFSVISFCGKGSDWSCFLTQSSVHVLEEGWAHWIPSLPVVHYLLTSHERRWNIWPNKWIICIFRWCFVLFIMFFVNPGISNLQLFLFDRKWILFCLSLKATHLNVPISSPYN